MPIVAMFIIFDFVIHNPLHPETRKNLSYLDIVSSHYARLDLASQGNVHDAKVAEFTSIARLYVDSLTRDRTNRDQILPATASSELSLGFPSEDEINLQQAMSAGQQTMNGTSFSVINDTVRTLFDSPRASALLHMISVVM
jgi:hypothetical protein